MDADDAAEHREPELPEPPVIPPPRRRRRGKWLLVLGLVVIALPTAVFALWSWIALSYTYSRGERAGYVQKFSAKGWVCKTWEGELAMVNVPGALQERWQFTVRGDSIAQLVLHSMGQRVALSYEEHRGLPSTCFGETRYFVTGVRSVATP